MIYKRGGRIYWYKFVWQGETIRESTKQGNDKVARQMEAAHRTSLAKGEVGIGSRKAVLTLTEFCEKRFEAWAESVTTPKTWRDFYRVGFWPLRDMRRWRTSPSTPSPVKNCRVREPSASEGLTGRLGQRFAASSSPSVENRRGMGRA